MNDMRLFLYNLATDRYDGFCAGLIKFFLFLLSFLYSACVRIMVFINRSFALRLNVKVISVGNITLGGTGKTTLVEFISRYLKQKKHKPAVLTRGYGKISQFPSSDSQLNYKAMGDEPYMLAKKLTDTPVIVDKDRIRGACRAVKEYCADTVILDDGFQQWRIKKDLEIVAIDATNPFGNRQMLPRGILREPLSALKRADIFVLTKTDLSSDLKNTREALNKINPKAMIAESVHQPMGFYDLNNPQELLDKYALKGKTVTLFSGIGDPYSFENMVAGLGVNIGLTLRFLDHHDYTRQDLDKIMRSSKEKGIDTLVTTEKDAARFYCEPRATGREPRILILKIDLKITQNEDAFRDRLLKLYSI